MIGSDASFMSILICPCINTFKPNGISLSYQWNQSISVFMVFFFFLQIVIDRDQTERSVASYLVQHCLPMSHKKDVI